MFMNFKFSRDYGECQAFQAVGVCCSSNTNSTDLLLEQQWTIEQISGSMPDETGGLSCFLP
jgi:hypothetical protein